MTRTLRRAESRRDVDPEVSICIPVYNRRHELERALASARAQTFEDLEIIIVDNASSDGSWEIAQAARVDPRVHSYRNDDTIERVANWDRALRRARGRYVKLLFSDDWLSPEAVELSVGVLRRRPDVAFVYSAMEWQWDRPQTVYYLEEKPGEMPSFDFLLRSATIEDTVPVTPTACLFRRHDLLELLEPDIPTRLPYDFSHYGLGNEGTVLWRCCDRYPYVYSIPLPLAHTADPASGQPNTRMTFGTSRPEMLWWAYRNAFARYIASSRRAERERAVLRSVLFLSSVPLRWRRFFPVLRTYRKLYPPHHPWWRMSLRDERAMRLLRRRAHDPPSAAEEAW